MFLRGQLREKSKLYGLVSALSSCKKSNLTMSRIKQIELYSQFGEHNSWKVKLVAKNNSEAITWYIPKKNPNQNWKSHLCFLFLEILIVAQCWSQESLFLYHRYKVISSFSMYVIHVPTYAYVRDMLNHIQSRHLPVLS